MSLMVPTPTTPSSTDFLQTTLEKCLGSQVQIRLLFDYLDHISHHPSQKGSLHSFMTKWKKLFHKRSRRTMVITFSGAWTPNCLGSQELCTQKQWKDFVLKYDPSFSQAMIDSECSPEYQPLNFKELIQLTFWKELYQVFGNQIVSHIFEKCAVLFDVDEGLYLMVAYSGGLVHQRMSKYEGCGGQPRSRNGIQLPLSSANLKNPYASAKQPSKVESTPTDEAEIHGKLLAIKYLGVEEPVPVSGSKLGGHKRKKVEDSWKVQVPGNNCSAPEDQPPMTKKQKTDAGLPATSETVKSVSGDSDTPTTRWLKPKPEELKKLVEHRMALLNSYSSTMASVSSGSSSNQEEEPSLNYIHIVKDEEFKPKDKLFVIKQKSTVSSTSKKTALPKDWKGLNIKEDLNKEFQKGKKKTILIHVYHIAETLARQLGIRLKPKGRSRKKSNRLQQPHSDIADEKISTVETTVENHIQSILVEEEVGQQLVPVPTAAAEKVPKPKYPFVSSIPLPIAPCLYNRSSWSRWPSSHCLSKASLEYSDDRASALRIVVDNIMQVPVCSESAHKYLMQAIAESCMNVSDSSIALSGIIFDIVQAHAQFKDIHRLVKSCAIHWRYKYSLKEERKNSRRTNSRNQKPKDSTEQNKLQDHALNDVPSSTLRPEPEVIEISDSPYSGQTPVTISSGSGRGTGTSVEMVENSQSSSVVKTLDKISLIPTTMSSTPPPPPRTEVAAVTSSSELENSDCRTVSSMELCSENAVVQPIAKSVLKKKAALVRKCSGNTKKHRSLKSLRDPVPYNCVMQSIKQVFHILKLEALLGSQANIRGFFKFLRKAIILGGTKSRLQLGELMALVNPQESPFAQVCGEDQLATETFMAKLVTWLFNDYVLILLRTSFYITECSNTRSHMKFFLRESWSSASHKMRTRLLREGALQPQNLTQRRANAIIRYIPKTNHTLRSLLIRKKSAWSISEDELKTLKLVLHYIDLKINKFRMHIPSTIQSEWRKFCRQWKDMGSPKLYYLRMDIRDAYPSVSGEKLKEILFKLGGDRERPQHVLNKQFALICGIKARKIIRGSIVDSYCRANWHSGIHTRPCIAFDLNRDKPVNVWKILDNVTTIITSSSTVKIGKKLFEFRYGLPQGWGPSSILCSIYYGYIDSTLYSPYLETQGRLFLRVVDDYLFITPVANEVLNLIQLIKLGCERYGIKMNEDKSETNIFVKSDVAVLESSCELTTFCGWNFCFTCGHVSRDYKKYNGQDFCSTISFQLENISSPEQFIRLRGTMIMPARLKPILMDPRINCSKRILLTVYEASVILGFRFYALCRVVYPSLSVINDPERSKVLIESLKICCARLSRFVIRQCNQISSLCLPEQESSCFGSCCGQPPPAVKNSVSVRVEPPQSWSQIPPSSSAKPSPRDLLNYTTFMYTSLQGFRVKLSKHSVVFRDFILPELDRSIFKLGRTLGTGHCEAVSSIIGDKMPACFQDIVI